MTALLIIVAVAAVLTGNAFSALVLLLPFRLISEWVDETYQLGLTEAWLVASVVLVLSLLWARSLKQKSLPAIDMPIILWFCFLLWGTYASILNESLSQSIVSLLRLLSIFLFFVVARELFAGALRGRLLNAMVFSSIASLAITGYQAIVGLTYSETRIAGGMSHPNNLALYSNLIVLMCVALYSESKKTSYLILAIGNFAAIVAALSLNGFVMSAISLLVFFRKQAKILAPIAVVLALGLLNYEPINNRLDSLSDFELKTTLEYGYSSNSFAWRFLNYRDLLPLVDEHPMIGYGLGRAEDIHPSNEGISPHNDYLRMLLETGLPGLGLWVALLGSISIRLWKSYSASRRSVDLAVFSVFFAWTIGSFFDNFITATAFQLHLWLAIGSAIGNKPMTESL